jgi:hypothetical protein
VTITHSMLLSENLSHNPCDDKGMSLLFLCALDLFNMIWDVIFYHFLVYF